MAHQPQNLVATAISTTEIELSWDDVETLESESYDIERDGVIVDSGYVGSHTVGSPYSDTGLDADTEYTYRVRAVGGTVVSTFSPADVAGLVAWFDFSDITTLFTDTALTTPVTADGQVIKGVTDKSGNGNHLIEATNGPTYKIAIINGESAARFDGMNDKLARDPLSTSLVHPYTVFYAGKLVAVVGDAPVIDGKAGSRGIPFMVAAGPVWSSYYAGAVITSAVAPDTDVHVMQATANGASSALRNDGGANLISGNPGTETLTNVTLATNANAGGGNFMQIDIQQLLLSTGDMSTADKNAIGVYLAAVAGTTWTTVS